MNAIPDKKSFELKIIKTFEHVEYPGDWCLRGSNEGEEPYLLEQEFKGKNNWQSLDVKFLDQAPGGFGSALNFFSDEAFHFYLPAYLIADIEDKLLQQNPAFQLTYGLTDATKDTKVNPRRYGERTWFQEKSYRFAIFNKNETDVIIEYLNFIKDKRPFEKEDTEQALKNYWLDRY